jgi:hypothetical protein
MNIPVCEDYHNDMGCEVTEAETMTAKKLNMHPEDVHNLMDWHMQSLRAIAEAKRAQYAVG